MLSYLSSIVGNLNRNNCVVTDDNSKYKNILEFIPKTTDNIIILDEKKKDLVYIIKTFCDKQCVKQFIVSLSGGVDSMVILYIIKNILNKEVIAIHIN